MSLGLAGEGRALGLALDAKRLGQPLPGEGRAPLGLSCLRASNSPRPLPRAPLVGIVLLVCSPIPEGIPLYRYAKPVEKKEPRDKGLWHAYSRTHVIVPAYY